MGDWVRKYTCGSCKEYEYEGENEKGYCNRYRTYYYPDDDCSHWEEKEGFSSGGSGCFLTTACCVYKGLPDDCAQLQAMRKLRDEWIMSRPWGPQMIKDYYHEAPELVKKINASPEREAILEGIFAEVEAITELIRQGNNPEAVIRYLLMLHRLTVRFQ